MKTIAGLFLAVLASTAAAQSIVPISGNGAVVAPGGVTPPIELRVRGIAGNPIPDLVVTFEQHCTYRMRGAAAPYACVSHPSPAPVAISDAVGRVVTPPYTADVVAGNAFIVARASIDGRNVNVPIYWTVGTSPRTPLNIVSGNNQAVVIGNAAAPLVAQVRDDFGIPVPDVPTQFINGCMIAEGAPCLLPPAQAPRLLSDNLGNVDSGVRVANLSVGSYFIRAYVEGAMSTSAVDFNLTNVLPARSASSRTKTGFTALLRMVDAPATCSITRMQLMDESLVQPAPFMLAVPQGLFEVYVDDCPAGSKISFELQHPGGFPEGATVWTVRPGWQPLASTNTIEGFWSFGLTDGAAGDPDNAANGSIRTVIAVGYGDPAAPNYQDLWWVSLEENGWGISVVQHRDVLFVVIFAYDSSGQPTWYVMSGGSWNATRDTYTGVIYSPRGRPIGEHLASHLVLGAPVGTLALTFSDVMRMRAAVTLGGTTTLKFLQRQLFGPKDARAVGRHDDLWWAGVQRNGWGLALHQQYASIFGVLFTYGTDGKPVWFVMPAGEWTMSNVYEGIVYQPNGPRWPDPYDPTLFVNRAVGGFKLDFANGTATFDFSAEGRSSRFSISRIPF